jgi:hypothetical protein
MSFFDTQMFLVMDTDVLPEHIKQTFQISPGFHGWRSDLSGIVVNVAGQDIDLQANGYVLVYANDDWHRKEAISLYDQIKALRHGAMVMSIPVEVAVGVQSPLTNFFGGSIIPIPHFPGNP